MLTIFRGWFIINPVTVAARIVNIFHVSVESTALLEGIRAHRAPKLFFNATLVFEMTLQGSLIFVISSTFFADKTTNVPLFHMIFLKFLKMFGL